MSKIERALISVTDKRGVADFASALDQLGVEIVSTGGTANTLTNAGISVVEVSEFTGFPEMMGGRLKTLNPKIHAGILFRRHLREDVEQMERHGLKPIDLVCVNLYAFEATAANPDVGLDEAVEHIDIGGPTLLRAAAKNHAFVTVVVEPGDYGKVIEEMKAHQGETLQSTRFELAKKVFQVTSAYDGAIANYLAEK
jgi:phosphoribosylaminoimidazolecarboxamide formyltransferase/IMP cyclohydrolase